eukprot:2606077-Prymnesium_polylepis.1
MHTRLASPLPRRSQAHSRLYPTVRLRHRTARLATLFRHAAPLRVRRDGRWRPHRRPGVTLTHDRDRAPAAAPRAIATGAAGLGRRPPPLVVAAQPRAAPRLRRRARPQVAAGHGNR